MTDSEIALFEKLKAIRTRTDLKLKPNKHLRTSIKGLDGVERPLSLRHYQVQMVLHLMAMPRFVVGDDTGTGKCITADTLIRTDAGMLRIGDIVPGGMQPDTFKSAKKAPQIVLPGTVGLAPIKNYYFGGKKPTLRVTTNRGYSIEGSHVHPLLVRNSDGTESFKKLSEISVGDFVCMDRGSSGFPQTDPMITNPQFSFGETAKTYCLPTQMSPELARFLGYLVAEGWVAGDNQFVLTQHKNLNREVHDDMRGLLLSIFGWQGNENSKDKDISIVVSSVQIVTFLRYMGIDPVLSADKCVPPMIFKSTRNSIIQFIRGYYDGEASMEGGCLEVSSASEILLKEIQILLLSLGIISSRNPKLVKGYDHVYWRLSIYGDAMRKFTEVIGILTPRKMVQMVSESSKKPNTNLDVIPYAAPVFRPIRDHICQKTSRHGFKDGGIIRFLGRSAYNGSNHVLYGIKNLTYALGMFLIEKANTIGVDASTMQSLMNNHYFYDVISEITPSEADVYDIEVDHPDHVFVGNGFVNHNTFSSLSTLTCLFDKNPNLKVLILTKKSAVSQWSSEVYKFTAGITPICVKGDKKNRHKIYDQFQQAHPAQPTVLIAGYRSFVQDFSTIQDWNWDVVVFDEASVFKSPSAQVHQICRHLSRQSERVWGLTATLIKNNLVEGYGIYKVIMPELFTHTPAAFIQDYCMIQMQNIGRGRKVPVIVGYRNADIERFKFKIEPYYLGRPKHEVAAELPPLTTKIVYVGMTSFQHNRYNEALAGLLTVGQASINGMEEKEVTKLTAVTYCQEITNHPSLIGYPDEESEKLNELVEMLSDGGELHGKKVIVFTRFEKMVTLGVAALEKAGVKSVRITGAEQDTKKLGDQRKINQDIFQDMNSGVQVVWITMAGSDAINLQAAECIIFYDTPFSAGDYLQCLGRLIRIGSIHQAVLAIHLVVEKTIDERVVEIVEKKMRLIEAVIGKRLKGDDSLDTSDIEAGKGDVVELFDALRRDAQSGRDTGILHV